MVTKKSASKSSDVVSEFRRVSWLKFLPKISGKQLISIILIVIVTTYGAYMFWLGNWRGMCNDWVFGAKSELSIGTITFDRPDGWQKNLCYTNNEEDYSMLMMRDYQIPDLARLAWISGFSDGWGMFAPNNSGLIEVGVGRSRSSESLDEIEKRYAEQTPPAWVKRVTRHITVDGKDALQIITQQGPNLNDKGSGRYSYYNDIFIEEKGMSYNLRLWNNWYKSESLDAWVAKYEPVFDKVVSSIKFQ